MSGLRRLTSLVLAMVLLAGLAACGVDQKKTLRIVAGSEQRAVLEQIVTPWCKDKGYTCEYDLLGSVDQARLLQDGSTQYDAYWFASSVFAQLGNTEGNLRHVQPMFLTPVVFAARPEVLDRMNLNRDDVTIADVVTAVESGSAKVWATNPTQSNSGATALFAFMNHFAGNGPGQPLTQEQLDSPQVDEGVRTFIRAIDRTPPSTGTMMEECVAAPQECEAMFTYEALVIEQNQQLVQQGQQPFRVVYPHGGIAISDAPLGFRATGAADAEKEKVFTELQDFLLRDAGARSKLLGLGRRPADSIGLTLTNPDQNVFNPAWGIKTDIREQGVTYPAAPVIEETLARYHTRYRRPTNIYYCLDGSGSMSGDGWDGVKRAAHEIFDAERARVNLLQTAPQDQTSVSIFNSTPQPAKTVTGNDPAQLKQLEQLVIDYRPGGGTDMYACLKEATSSLQARHTADNKSLIVLMSDGQSSGDEQGALQTLRSTGIPVVSIAFGSADPGQLRPVGEASGGAYVESGNLVQALRTAAGYK
ncbi:vWA domain-containing protein [Granulicoccus phenolivorans]|uniref:vWA domain-containing protein n=1 Tax=Granulicoccus phenolivorans TaxID=266854 RepID=UPI0009DBF2AE|nr:vWA domain-containing protein [Granulicoccus phenolivorans]